MMRRRQALGTSTITEGTVTKRVTWRLRTGVLAALTMALLLANPILALADTSGDNFVVKDPPQGVSHALKSFAGIELSNGDEVMFTSIPDERGRPEGVLVTEQRSANRASVRSISGLGDANPLEIYNALMKPDTRVPAILIKLYGADSRLGQQGWARDLAITPGPTFAQCNAAGDWSADLDLYANDFNDDNPFKSTWNGPSSMPQDWAYAPPGNGEVYYDLNGQANNVTAFYSSVLYCDEDYEHAITYDGQYYGNYVTFYYRIAGHGVWNFSQQTQLENVGDRIDHLYYPGNLFSPSAAEFDFHLTISQAKPADQFHIGATWVNGGPTDIKLAS